MFQHELGHEATDKITGFKGLITGRIEYITGCNQYSLTPKVDEKGAVQAGEYFDEGRIVITGPGITAPEVQGEKKGGPNRDAPKR